MGVDTILSWIGAAVAIVVAIAGVIKGWRTTPIERVDVATKYEEMASRQAEQIDKMKQRIDELEEAMKTAEKEFLEYKTSTEKRFLEWQHGLALLVHQLEAAGQTPVWKPKTGELKL